MAENKQTTLPLSEHTRAFLVPYVEEMKAGKVAEQVITKFLAFLIRDAGIERFSNWTISPDLSSVIVEEPNADSEPSR